MNRLSTIVVIALAGCASNLDTFKKDNLPRAAFEMNCPADQVTATEFDYNTIGLTGCNKKAVYVYLKGTGWVNNTGQSAPDPAAAATPAPSAAAATAQ